MISWDRYPDAEPVLGCIQQIKQNQTFTLTKKAHPVIFNA
jgi:hypothetical protein